MGYHNIICCSFVMLCWNDFCAWCTRWCEVLWIIVICCCWFLCRSNWFEDNAKSYHFCYLPTKTVFICHCAFKALDLHWWNWQVRHFMESSHLHYSIRCQCSWQTKKKLCAACTTLYWFIFLWMAKFSTS